METQLLESLITGMKIKLKSKERRLYILEGDDTENPKNPEISLHENPIEEVSFCWHDFYEGQKLAIFGSWSNETNLYESSVYNVDWISNTNGLFIVELPDYKYINEIMKEDYKQDLKFREFYDPHVSAFARIIARAMGGISPYQYEIEDFRRSKPYFDIFNKEDF